MINSAVTASTWVKRLHRLTDECYEIKSGYYQCDLIKHDKQWKYLPKAGAVVVDGSGYTAALCVEEDFGCNRWEAKP